MEQRALSLYFITAPDEPLLPLRARAIFNAEADVEFEIHYAAPFTGPLRFRALYLSKMPARHIGTLRVIDADGTDLDWAYLEAGTPKIEVPFPRAKNSGAGNGEQLSRPASRASAPGFASFLKLGIEHILTGYDHLLFLAALLLACRRFATMAGIITCFTLAHSLTLALAALEVVSLPPKLVEPLIAASIMFVGLENLLRRDGEPKGRWAVTFCFGLIHGFGFAGALRETGLGAGGSSLLPPLFAFNLGVETGQIAVATLFLPVLFRLRRSPDFVRFGLPAASTIIIALGSYWLLQRTVFS